MSLIGVTFELKLESIRGPFAHLAVCLGLYAGRTLRSGFDFLVEIRAGEFNGWIGGTGKW